MSGLLKLLGTLAHMMSFENRSSLPKEVGSRSSRTLLALRLDSSFFNFSLSSR
ncbi:uncharacterized protein DS421_16g537070 [Arachis hypogaea]|nr:uncharacterized protein DS421_16g537070 [Arachis hypogaea]